MGLKQELRRIDSEFEAIHAAEIAQGRSPILDGAINFDEYAKSTVKILWLMKEPYEGDGGTGGGWSFADEFQSMPFVHGLVFGPPRTTWQPVTYVSYGIKNGLFWNEMNYIRTDHQMIEALKSIAWVNIQKLPSLNRSRTNMKNVLDCYANQGHLVRKQIELLDPHVIICANTFHVIKNDYKLNSPVTIPGVDVYFTEERLIIHAYHPAQRIISRQLYVDSLIEAVKRFSRA